MTGTPVQLGKRPATEDDIPFLLSLRAATMDRHLIASGVSLTDGSHRQRVLHHFDCAEILTDDGRAVGLLKVSRATDEWEVVQIQLDQSLQGKGHGRALLQQVIDDAAAAGAGVRLSVLKANPARQLYERLGFKVHGEDAHEYLMRRSAPASSNRP